MTAPFREFPNLSSLAWRLGSLVLSGEKNPQTPIRIFVPDSDFALQLSEEIVEILGKKEACACLVALETNLVRHRGPTSNTKLQRLRSIAALQNAHRPIWPKFLIIAADAVCQPILDPLAFQTLTLSLRTGEPLSRTDLVHRLVNLGYQPAEVVEVAGTYAARGSIVDIFCPQSHEPIRVELFADEIQSIRVFDSVTQRKVSDLARVVVGPAREGFLENQTESALSIFKAYADKNDWLRQDRNDVVERLQHKAYFSTFDYWASVFQKETHPFLCEWIESTNFSFDFFINYEQCLHSLKTSWTHQSSQINSARAEREWVPSSNDFLAPLQKSLAVISAAKEKTSFVFSLVRNNTLEIETHSVLSTKISSSRTQSEASPLGPLYEETSRLLSQGYKILFTATTVSQLERLDFFLKSKSQRITFLNSTEDFYKTSSTVCGLVLKIESGFTDKQNKISVITDEEIFGKRKKRASSLATSKKASSVFSTGDLGLLSLEVGDFLVQSEHGVGRYLGLKIMRLNGIDNEFIEIEYAESNKLFVPVSRLNTVQRLGGKEYQTPLDKLGGQTWETKKSKAKKDVRSIAVELIQLYSKRQLTVAPCISPTKKILEEFASTFAFEETPDQAKAIDESIADLAGPRPMDRVLCGDVGYGKTEVALRTAHAALSCGYQVAVLVPTTILASQHELVFSKRLSALGYSVKGVSRFKDSKDVKQIAEGIKAGSVHLVVGTHRLLSESFSFKNLGLIVVDEEQRFGVTHKEKLKRLKSNVHVLTMTATPIPRTLNMALSGLRELSIISTPPVDRLSVKTFIARKKPSLVQEAIRNELARDGQVFYLHNRIQDIHLIQEELSELVPEAKISIVHGQLEEDLLESRMLDFYSGKTQVLITTTIIESGLDVPNANTLIVERANHFGLSQLYQIRGRVGRSAQKAFAYFLLPQSGEITKDAEARLNVLESYQDLGSGFHIASHDLDIRGAGDLLGRSQSGHMHAIGFDTYVSILEECVAELQGETLESTVDPEINIPIESNIPQDFIPDVGLRLSYYKKLASAESDDIFVEIEEELEDRFGRPPQSVLNLLRIMKIKVMLRRLGVKSLTSGKLGYALVFDASTPIKTEALLEKITKYPQNYQVSPDGKFVIKMPGGLNSPPEMLKMAESSLEHLTSLVL